MTQPTEATEADITFDAGGESFTLRVFADPSGLRGQVFRGDEKIAGVQIYHSKDPQLLLRAAQRDKAVLRAAGTAC